MTYKVSTRRLMDNAKIVVVGCGGTGGFVAEGVCRLLIGTDFPLLLIDHDRVEPHNLVRQQFFAGDVGKFKSQALAERLARQYGRPVAYSVYPYMHDLVGEDWGGGFHTRAVTGIIIGCVDNVAARRAISSSMEFGNWWLDAGNGQSSGQVLIGNASKPEELEGAFEEAAGLVDRLPIPSLQLPSLLAPPTDQVSTPRDCAEAVMDQEQGPVINQAMATLVLQFIYKFLTGELRWMGAYLDLEAGTLRTVPTEPVIVARMLGVKVDTLIGKGCSIGNRYRMHG
ncbi:MAG: ThiF family adenylyltransferase [Chloroflexi bacterium]|nr:ThiF family adenylyltransferase [Chloroflexota bacterium]